MTPERRAELVKEWKDLAAKLRDVQPGSAEERQLLRRQDVITREIGEDLSKERLPRT